MKLEDRQRKAAKSAVRRLETLKYLKKNNRFLELKLILNITYSNSLRFHNILGKL